MQQNRGGNYALSDEFSRGLQDYFDNCGSLCIISDIVSIAVWKEGRGLELLRRRLAEGRDHEFTSTPQVVEPELDMTRTTEQGSSIVHSFLKLIRWLTPDSSSPAAPKRSVGREIEEAFPEGREPGFRAPF